MYYRIKVLIYFIPLRLDISHAGAQFCLHLRLKVFHRPPESKLYTADVSGTFCIFVDNQWFNAEKLYSSCTGVHFCCCFTLIFVYFFLKRFYPHLLNNLFFVWRHLLKAAVVADIV